MIVHLACLTLLMSILSIYGLYEEYPETKITENELKEAREITSDITIAMTESEVAMFLRLIKKAKSYFEFGCGGSTMVASKSSNKDLKIYSADSSKEWIDKVLENPYAAKRKAAGQLTMQYVDIGPIGAWGVPTKIESKGSWYLYSQAISMAKVPFDLVLVDGRFRVASMLNTFLSNPNATVLIHDFFEPGHHNAYRDLLRVADVAERANTLVSLKRKDGATKEDLMKMYAAYIHIASRK